MAQPVQRFLATAGALATSALLTGCAVHYYDKKAGAEHLWGFGHLTMKAAPTTNTVRAVVTGVQSLGLNIGVGCEDYSFGAGWDDRRRIMVLDNTSVCLEWPDNNFFNVRVGSEFPFTNSIYITNSTPEQIPP